MGAKESLEVLEKIAEVATLIGVKGKVDDEVMAFVTGFGLPEGRSQMVFVVDTTRDPDNKIVTIYSPALMVKKGLFGGFSKEKALDLLRRNEQMHFARYGIRENEKKVMVVASIDHLLDTLDPPELEASLMHVALAADAYEREHGRDDF